VSNDLKKFTGKNTKKMLYAVEDFAHLRKVNGWMTQLIKW
jgi:hypothetical protein